MSAPSITSPKSPSSQWLSNEHTSSVSRKSSDHAAPTGHSEPEPDQGVTSNDGDTDHDEIFPMNYPIDENLFNSAPSQPLGSNITRDSATVDEKPSTEGLLPPPDFKPFFTLIEDTDSGEHQHPTVHYVFSDDDPEILTSAALNSLDEENHDDHTSTTRDEVEERYAVVDMASDGKSIASVSSMSPQWQALKCTINQAPSWGDDPSHTSRGSMLKVSGQGIRSTRSSREQEQKRQQTPKNLEELVGTFSERLGGLDEVLGRNQAASKEQETT